MGGTIAGTPVGGNTKAFIVTPVIQAAAYAAGQSIGVALTLTAAALKGANSGCVHTIRVADKAKQNVAMDLLFFNAALTVAPVDKTTFDPTDADMLKCIGHVPVAASDYSSFSDNSIATVRNVGFGFWLPSEAEDLIVHAVSRGAPTYASTSDLEFLFLILQD